MGNNMTVTQKDCDHIFDDKEYYDYRFSFVGSPFCIARNESAYFWNERYGGKEAILYWSPKESTIKGMVYEARRIGDWNNPHRYYVKILFDDVVNTKAQLTTFNKSKGKRADSDAGHTWNKRWFTPHHNDLAMGNRMPLGDIWKQAKKSPYNFLKFTLGILNHRTYPDWRR